MTRYVTISWQFRRKKRDIGGSRDIFAVTSFVEDPLEIWGRYSKLWIQDTFCHGLTWLSFDTKISEMAYSENCIGPGVKSPRFDLSSGISKYGSYETFSKFLS